MVRRLLKAEVCSKRKSVRPRVPPDKYRDRLVPKAFGMPRLL